MNPARGLLLGLLSSASCAAAFAAEPAPRSPGKQLVVGSVRIVDVNGDHDGIADTGETVDLFVTVSNKSGRTLTDLGAQLVTEDPRIACISVPFAAMDTIAPGATIELATPFRFQVGAQADRGGTAPPATCNGGSCSNGAGPCSVASNCVLTPDQEYAASFLVVFSGPDLEPTRAQGPIVLDLDLNIDSASVPTTTIAEGFESGLTGWAVENLDANRATNALSNGYRCQYTDPDSPNSNSYGETECYLGFASGQSPANHWHAHTPAAVNGGRAFAGSNSLHYGVHTTGNPGLDTTGLSQLDAIRSAFSFRLASRICRDDPAANQRACGTDADCLAFGGGPCVPASPQLSFKHQIRLMYEGDVIQGEGEMSDRAVVFARIAGSAVRTKLYPYENVFDLPGTDQYSNCMFDPIDDGSTEDSRYSWSLDFPYPVGPSSTCKPEYTFTRLGNTGAPFSPTDLGRASDGPGLAGSLGQGTWVQSRFDLSRFRGRSIQISFLVTTLKIGGIPTWQDLFHFNPTADDDGWYVDDVRVTQTLGAASATARLDSADNSAFPLCDSDADGFGDAADNCPFDFNPDQTDADGDGPGDACDSCPDLAGVSQYDSDGDGLGDACDALPMCASNLDSDADGACDEVDGCPTDFDPLQRDGDGDNAGDPCDNCPLQDNLDQTDDDGDGLGDACDACPLGADGDGDGVLCPGDNCPATANTNQADADGDGLGDACDACAATPGSDPDADGVCGTADNCATRFNPDQGDSIRLAADGFAGVASADSSRVLVHIRDGANLGVGSVAPTGGPVTQVAAPHYAVSAQDITKDGLLVLYTSQPGAYEDSTLYVASTRGGSSRRLDSVSGYGIYDARFSPDEARVVYRTFAGLFSAPVEGGEVTPLSGSRVGPFAITPDSAHVVYLSYLTGAHLWSVPIEGGASTSLYGSNHVAQFLVTPDGQRVVFEETVSGPNRLYSVPVLGGPSVLLLTGGFEYGDVQVSPDSSRVVYRLHAPEGSPNGTLQSVSILGGAESVLSDSNASSFQIASDSRVVYLSGSLYSVGITGGTPQLLSASPVAGSVGYDVGADGSRVVFAQNVSFEQQRLVSVPIDGGDPVVLHDLVSQGVVFIAVTPDGNHVIYQFGAPYSLATTPVTGGAVRILDVQSSWYGPTPISTPDSRTVLFHRFDPSSSGLFAAQIEPDGDGDGVLTVCDVCPDSADPDQADADLDGRGDACDVCPDASDVGQADADLDGYSAACDCDDTDSARHPGAEEINDGEDNQCPGEPGYGTTDELSGQLGFHDPANRIRVSWPPQPLASVYRVARAIRADHSFGLTCFSTSAPFLDDASVPATLSVYFYLARAVAPHAGSYGVNSAGVERVVPCP